MAFNIQHCVPTHTWPGSGGHCDRRSRTCCSKSTSMATASAEALQERTSSSNRHMEWRVHPASSTELGNVNSSCRSDSRRTRLQTLVDANLQLLQRQGSTSNTTSSSVVDVEAVLDSVYETVEQTFYSKRGHIIPHKERALIDAAGGSGAATYGEVTPKGVRQLLQWLPMDSSSVFADLGCGIGRVLLHVAAARPDIAEARGIEMSESRLEEAQAALELVQEAGVTLPASVQLVPGDLTKCDLNGITHCFMCSTAFSAGLCRTVAERLAGTPGFRVLVTSRPLPPQPYLRRVGSFPCSFSWIESGRAHVYVRSWETAPPALLAQFCCAGGLCWLPDGDAVAFNVALVSAEAEEDAERALAPPVAGLQLHWPMQRGF